MARNFSLKKGKLKSDVYQSMIYKSKQKPSVKKHAIIKWVENQPTIFDNKSKNGLFVNEQRVIDGKILKENDKVQFGLENEEFNLKNHGDPVSFICISSDEEQEQGSNEKSKKNKSPETIKLSDNKNSLQQNNQRNASDLSPPMRGICFKQNPKMTSTEFCPSPCYLPTNIEANNELTPYIAMQNNYLFQTLPGNFSPQYLIGYELLNEYENEEKQDNDAIESPLKLGAGQL